MSKSLQSQANDRRARIAALRKKTQNNPLDQQITRPENSTNDEKTNTQEVQISTKETNDNNHKYINQKYDSKDDNSTLEIKNAQIVDYNEPVVPCLRISNSETVEVIAGKIQQEIFDRLRVEASQAIKSSNNNVKSEKFINNSDLKVQLDPYLKRAHTRTQHAINRIVQKNYNQQNSI